MTKPLVLSNGTMSVGIDEFASVSQVFYPYIGMYNQMGAEIVPHHKLGIYVDDAIHWLDDNTWKITVDYQSNRLTSSVVADNKWLDIRLDINDYIDCELNVLCRAIKLTNLSTRNRKMKLYMHQAFSLGGSANSDDTAQYIPADTLKDCDFPSITHYKDNQSISITGFNIATKQSFDDFSIGRFGGIGDQFRAGVWCDAADGRLAGNTVETGLTDSIIGFDIELSSNESSNINYLMSAGTSIEESTRVLQKFHYEGIDFRTNKTNEYWSEWTRLGRSKVAKDKLADSKEDGYQALINWFSLKIGASVNNEGSIVSDPITYNKSRHSSLKCYSYESALIGDALYHLGHRREVDNLFSFASKTLSCNGYLYPSYNPDGSIGSNGLSWMSDGVHSNYPISSKDTAAMLYLFCRIGLNDIAHGDKTADLKRRWRSLARPMADFLSDFIDPATKLPRPSYDRDFYCVSTYTVAMTYGALSLAAELADKLRDTNGSIAYRTVSDEIRDKADVLRSSNGSIYRGITMNGNNQITDNTNDFWAIYGAYRYKLFDDTAKDRILSDAFESVEKGSARPSEPEAILNVIRQARLLISYGDTKHSRSLLNEAADKLSANRNISSAVCAEFVSACIEINEGETV